MKPILTLILALALCLCAFAQDFTVKTGLSHFDLKVEYSQPMRMFEDVFGLKGAVAGFYVSGGTIGSDGRPTGAFSALVQIRSDWPARGLRLDAGPALRLTRDPNDSNKIVAESDLEIQLVVLSTSRSKFAITPIRGREGGLGVLFQHRF